MISIRTFSMVRNLDHRPGSLSRVGPSDSIGANSHIRLQVGTNGNCASSWSFIRDPHSCWIGLKGIHDPFPRLRGDRRHALLSDF